MPERFLANFVSPAEVLDETIATALDDQIAISRASCPSRNGSTGSPCTPWIPSPTATAAKAAISAWKSPRGIQNVSGTDDEYLQFHQPDDSLFAEDIIPDPNRSNPEDVVYSRESIEQVGGALACLKSEDRDAFVLFALEGFTVPEIARIAARARRRRPRFARRTRAVPSISNSRPTTLTARS